MDNTQHPQETDIHASERMRTRNSSKPEAADPHLIDGAAAGVVYKDK